MLFHAFSELAIVGLFMLTSCLILVFIPIQVIANPAQLVGLGITYRSQISSVTKTVSCSLSVSGHHFPNGTAWWIRICLYFGAFITPSIFSQISNNIGHTITEPPLCFTIGCMHHCISLQLFFEHNGVCLNQQREIKVLRQH